MRYGWVIVYVEPGGDVLLVDWQMPRLRLAKARSTARWALDEVIRAEDVLHPERLSCKVFDRDGNAVEEMRVQKLTTWN